MALSSPQQREALRRRERRHGILSGFTGFKGLGVLGSGFRVYLQSLGFRFRTQVSQKAI